MQFLYLKNIKYHEGEIFYEKITRALQKSKFKPIDNNRKVYYMKEEDARTSSPTTIEEELDSIFHTLGYSL